MKKLTKGILTVTPILGMVTGVGTYLGVKISNNRKTKTKEKMTFTGPDKVRGLRGGDHESSVFSKFRIFPQLNAHHFYDYLKMENGKPIIDDAFISQVVNKVLKNILITDGSIEWSYKLNDERNNLILSFKWVNGSQGKEFTKSYKFDVAKSV